MDNHKRYFAIIVFFIICLLNLGLKAANSDFPLGFYHIKATEDNFQRIKNLGFNYVHWYPMGSEVDEQSLSEWKSYLDLADKYNLKVMVNLYVRKWVSRPDGIESVQKFVDHISGHPALGFWLLVDEPDLKNIPQERLKPFYNLLKNTNPDIPVANVVAWSDKWDQYGEVSDILQYDVYPVCSGPSYQNSLQLVTNWTEDIIAKGFKPMPVIQAFNYASLYPNIDKVFLKGQLRNVSDLRYPTVAELRYMSYGCLAQGVKGLFFWSYGRSVQLGTDWIDGSFAEFAGELKDFVDTVGKPDEPKYIFNRAKDENIYMALWENDNQQYLLLVNAWPVEKPISRSTQGRIQKAHLEPFGLTSSKEASIIDGKVSVVADPWEVFIWKVKEPSQYEDNEKKTSEFPIGILDVNPDKDIFQYLKSIGFNYVHRYWQGNSLDDDSIQRDKDYLDLAVQNDIKVMFHLYGQTWVNDPNGLQNMKTIVDTFKNHPAIGMWQIYDEPDTGGHQNSPEEIKPFSDMLKNSAPNIPLSIIFAWSNSWWKYQDLLDVCMLDYYTVMDEEPNQAALTYVPRFTGKMKGLGKKSIPIIQAFNYACFYKDKEEVNIKRKNRKVADLRYPTTNEMRYLCFSSIAQAADGLFFYSHKRSTQLGDEWLKQDLAPVITEVSIFADEVLEKGNAIIYHNQDDNQTVYFGKTKLDDICLTGWKTPKGYYLILTNNSPKASDIQRKIEPLQEDTFDLIPWGKTRHTDAKLLKGELKCKANPWEVFIWKLK